MRVIALVLLLSACPSAESSTFDDPPPCGEGTAAVDGWCVPDDGLGCGEGTVAVDGWCVPDDGLGCGDGTIERDGECVAVDRQWVHLPLLEGTAALLGQTFHGNFSHRGSERYAVDIPLGHGTPVAAMRAGTVIELKEDSDTGCGTPDCAPDGNFITVDHGDGTQGLYYHLEQNGAVVEVGDGVCGGEVIGYSGNTGFSTGPHLHTAVQDPFGLTLPLRYLELAEDNGGVPAPGQLVTSTNAEDAGCEPPALSSCPEDLFAFLGVRLDPGAPCSLVERDRVYPVSGRASHGSTVVAGTWRLDPVNGGSAFSYQCVEQDADGRFSLDLEWPREAVGETSYLVFAASDSTCSTYGGWAYSAKITFLP